MVTCHQQPAQPDIGPLPTTEARPHVADRSIHLLVCATEEKQAKKDGESRHTINKNLHGLSTMLVLMRRALPNPRFQLRLSTAPTAGVEHRVWTLNVIEHHGRIGVQNPSPTWGEGGARAEGVGG